MGEGARRAGFSSSAGPGKAHPGTIFGFIVPFLVTIFHASSTGPTVLPIGARVASLAEPPAGAVPLIVPLAGQPREVNQRPPGASIGRELVVTRPAGSPPGPGMGEPEETRDSGAFSAES